MRPAGKNIYASAITPFPKTSNHNSAGLLKKCIRCGSKYRGVKIVFANRVNIGSSASVDFTTSGETRPEISSAKVIFEPARKTPARKTINKIVGTIFIFTVFI